MIKLCECGCGQPAPIAKATNKTTGAIIGKPQRFVLWHAARVRHLSAMKVCIMCSRKLPRTSDHFEIKKGTKDGLSGRCKACIASLVDMIAAREEKKRLYQIAYRNAHREKTKEYGKRYRAENSVSFLERIRQWRLRNFEKVREYSRKNRWKMAAVQTAGKHRRRAKEREAFMEEVDLEKGLCSIKWHLWDMRQARRSRRLSL
jgi:hypothetical protein